MRLCRLVNHCGSVMLCHCCFLSRANWRSLWRRFSLLWWQLSVPNGGHSVPIEGHNCSTSLTQQPWTKHTLFTRHWLEFSNGPQNELWTLLWIKSTVIFWTHKFPLLDDEHDQNPIVNITLTVSTGKMGTKQGMITWLQVWILLILYVYWEALPSSIFAKLKPRGLHFRNSHETSLSLHSWTQTGIVRELLWKIQAASIFLSLPSFQCECLHRIPSEERIYKCVRWKSCYNIWAGEIIRNGREENSTLMHEHNLQGFVAGRVTF